MAAAYITVIFEATILANTIARHIALVRVCSTTIVWVVRKYDGCRTPSWRRNDGTITQRNNETDWKCLEEKANEEQTNGCFSKQAVGWGNSLESSGTATHTQLSTTPGPSSASDSAAVHSDDLVPAQQEDSSCSDVSHVSFIPVDKDLRIETSWI